MYVDLTNEEMGTLRDLVEQELEIIGTDLMLARLSNRFDDVRDLMNVQEEMSDILEKIEEAL